MGQCGGCRSNISKPDSRSSSQASSTLQTPLVRNNTHARPLPPLREPSVPRATGETTSPLTPSSSEKPVADESKHLPKKFVNILLLGESGVGKSTFINAIVNYFHFDTLADAREPLVLMPVSFIITEGDDFRERLVTLADADPNEDHHHPGQSVTQHCRSYVFSISARTTIRLIDTPGMGDTRGLDQDDRNMQHILSFISHLSHLDAICILLKPNLARLNVVFRSYFTRLLGFLGERARKNVIFCYTNTRSTFYAPGDTGPLLKSMLASQSMQDVPHTKKNTFCFDSEAFRYLIARRNGVRFGDDQKREYEASWTRSAAESRRLFEYICQDIRSCRQEDWRSVEHAHVQINGMKRQPSSGTVILISCIVNGPSAICRGCRQTARRHDDFWILDDDLHFLSDKCNTCSCNRKEHIDVDYKLTHEVRDDTSGRSLNQLQSDLKQLRTSTLDFGRFLRCNCSVSRRDDPILSYLKHMIRGEGDICEKKGGHGLNALVLAELSQYKQEYEQHNSAATSDARSINLDKSYKLISEIMNMNLIREQMNVIDQYNRQCMKIL